MTPLCTDLPAIPLPGADISPPQLREWARYSLGDMRRVLCTRVSDGQRVLIDLPADQFNDVADPVPGDVTYVVESQLSANDEELIALITDYLQQVEVHQRIPMSGSLLGQVLETELL